MAFRFSLNLVLRVRHGLERRQELLLAAANHQVSWLRQTRQEIQKRLALAASERVEKLNVGVSAAELHFEAGCRSALESYRQLIHKQLLEAEATRDACVERLRQLRRERETLEVLRQNELHAYRKQENRRAQRELDDILLLRRAYRG
jgi:flagellar export protein FliJ